MKTAGTPKNAGGPKILTGNQFLLEGFSESELRQIRSVISAQGGSVSAGFHPKISCLVTKVVGGPMYRICLAHNVPAVQPQWLIDCISQKRWVSFSNFYVPPFFGLIISSTGFEVSDRDEIKQAVEKYGGVFMKDLMKGTTTHLVCMTPSGAKYESAKMWGDVKIINAHWIVDCVETNQWKPEENYPCESDSANGGSNQANDVDHIQEMIGTNPPAQSKISAVSFVPTETGSAAAVTSSSSATREVPATITPRDKMVKEASNLHKVEQYIIDNLSLQDLPHLADTGNIELKNNIMFVDNTDWTCAKRLKSLQGCVIFLAGYPHGIRQYLQRLILVAGGQVSVVLSQDVHFVALYMSSLSQSSAISIQQIQANQQLLTFHQRTLRLSQQCGVRRINLLWCLDVVFGREMWQDILSEEMKKLLLPPPIIT